MEAYRQDDVDLGKDVQNYPNWVQLRNFSYNNGNSQFSIYWKSYYRGISFCNQIIDKVATMSEGQLAAADRKQLLAEAHFLRGFYHMQLLLNWEKLLSVIHISLLPASWIRLFLTVLRLGSLS